jgi:voltage-gated potassium channel
LGVLLVFIFVGAAGYTAIEGYGWQEAVYMTVIVISTVGMSQFEPLSHWGLLWTLFIVAGGIASGAVVLSILVAMVVEGQIRSIFGRRNLEKEIEALSGHVIICGFGRMGSMVAGELLQQGQNIVVIDRDQQRTEAADRAFLLYVLGDAHDEETLRSAGIQRAAVLVAALSDDAANVFITLSAKGSRPEIRIIARAQEASAEGMLRKAGADRVISPHVIGASRIADLVMRPAVVDFVEMAHRGIDLEMDQIELRDSSALAGKTLRELELPRRMGVVVVAVQRSDGSAVYHPTPDLTLESGDTMVLVGKRGAAIKLQGLQAQAESKK